ncbi:hypothetical protein LTR08_000130 [Meristemomyces frigidus]|nr:hypothetical protein LTR08_000130 [Meristemomyces frigidus]
MSDKVVLYDLANTQGTSWSPNPWKGTFTPPPLVVESLTANPDLAPKFKALGIPPNDPDAFAEYSSPTVRLADGSYVMDTAKIVPKLEETYPEPSLHLTSPMNKEASELIDALLMALLPGVLPDVVNLLQEPSKSWFVEDRERRLGMTLEALAQKAGGEHGWQKAEPLLHRLKGLLEKNKDDAGPFILGSKPSFGDLVIVAMFEGMRKITRKNYDRLMGCDASFQKLDEACKPWTKKDD